MNLLSSDINVHLQLYVTFTLNLFIYFFSSVDTVQHFGYDEMETGLRFTMFWGKKIHLKELPSCLTM